MLKFLNDMFANKGLEFTDIIITDVALPQEIKNPLDEKAQFASLNDKEREQYNFDMRIIDDQEELEALRQRRYEQRDSIKEDFSKQITLNRRELEIVQAQAKKSVAEINEQSKAEQAQIKANAELKKEEILGETIIVKTRDEVKGRTEAEMIEIQAKNQSNIKIAEKMLEISEIKAQTTEVIGAGEAQIAKVMASKRKYEHLNKKLEVIEGFKDNKNLKIFGDNNDDVMSQMAAYRITNDGKRAL